MSDHDPVRVWEDHDEGIGYWDNLTPDEQAALWDESRQRAATYLDAIQGDALGTPDAGEGPCSDCGHIAPHRWRLAQLELCRRCITLRHGAAKRLGGEAPRPAPSEPEPEPPPTEPSDAIEKVSFTEVNEVLKARAALAEDLPRPTTTNGQHTDDDLWQPPDF